MALSAPFIVQASNFRLRREVIRRPREDETVGWPLFESGWLRNRSAAEHSAAWTLPSNRIPGHASVQFVSHKLSGGVSWQLLQELYPPRVLIRTNFLLYMLLELMD